MTSRPLLRRQESSITGRIAARGKFLFAGDEKFFVKGVTYGPFAPGTHGDPFPPLESVDRDFTLMVQMGANTLRTFTVPPPWLLDRAAAHGLRVLVGIPWSQHVAFLDSAVLKRQTRNTIADGVRSCQRHPAVLAYLIGNEIPPDIIRWHGHRRIEAFLRDLVAIVKGVDDATLVGYANFPSTEYLDVETTDFAAFNVYLHREPEFRRYLGRLQHRAGDRPLVLTEFGIDSIREGVDAQARILSWQVRAAFELGVAGTVVFAWTDEWFAGGYSMEGWAFGLVTRERAPKPAFRAIQDFYRSSLPPALEEPPTVSVVVCAYNEERTLDMCLRSLEKLRYPRFEVIVVDDGSTDRTADICHRHPWVRLLRRPVNGGLSAARNLGIEAAGGEIIAFTDADCVVDPDWLTYLVAPLCASTFDVVGGPNLPPPNEPLVASCVAVAPGGPNHVLLTDEIAEHVPGCNMAFHRDVLKRVGGFDPQFRTAGDDVDICWRIQDLDEVIGFSPAALVWHFRRHTVKAYLKQQRGYGKAEALLSVKHSHRFNGYGQSRWQGRIYGGIASAFRLGRPLIYSGAFGRGAYQLMYEPSPSVWAHLPLAVEWNVAATLLFACALVSGGWGWFLALPLLASWGWCAAAAFRARLDPRHNGLRARALLAALIYLGPLVRGFERYRWRMRRATPGAIPREAPPPRWSWRDWAFTLSLWSEAGVDKEPLLRVLANILGARGVGLVPDHGWSDCDLEAHEGVWARACITVATEDHGAGRRLLRVRWAIRPAAPVAGALAVVSLLGAMQVFFGTRLAVVSFATGLLFVAATAYHAVHLGRLIRWTVWVAARRLRLPPHATDPNRAA